MPPHEEAHNAAFEPEEGASSPPAASEVADRSPEVADSPPEVASKKPDPMSLEEAQNHVATSAGKFERRERWKILKNVVAISFAFMCLFTSFQGISNLQSSINSEGGVGTMSQAAVYLALILSCLFLPSLVIKRLTCKWTMVVCTLLYSVYLAAQFYPRPFTMIPGAIVLGLAAAPMWSAKCTYLTQVGRIHAEIIGEDSEPVIVKFFGIFFLFFQSAQIWGNLISSLVLSPGGKQLEAVPSEESLAICGINYCPGIESASNNTNLERPPESQIYTMAGIFLALAVACSGFIALTLDKLDRYGEKERASADTPPLQLLLATFTHMKKPYQLLVIPLTMWSGFEQAFIMADFSKAFVSCAWGIHRVGLVFIVYGIVDSICSFSFGFIIKRVGRVPLFLVAAALNYGALAAFHHWLPRPDEALGFFLVAAAWGAADAVWQTQINALYGVIFPDTAEAAFSNYRLWESLGYAIAFINAELLCLRHKVDLLIAVLTVGMIGYLVIELLERRRARGSLKVSKE
ncbi:UNC93-like protein [Amphibalanus amphitrite]|uniref:UNC93-like protein n=1 Tax=Amphibalanus amphitrite TaxID=1232801 RepID=UPI001C90C098|nr:UNC93-like protein [Amphibalanus amphitrite]